DHPRPHVRPRQRLALGQSRVDPRTEIAPVADHLGEQPELADGAPALALYPAARKPALRHRPLDQFVAQIEDVLGDRLQERRPRLARSASVRVESLGGEPARLVELLPGRAAISRLQSLARLGIDAPNLADR